jgi:type II secretory pathway pseudopilin PulG
MARHMPNGKAQASGFILLGVLVILVIAGYGISASCIKWSEAVKRDREQELLKVGDHIRRAIGRYYEQTPGPVKQYPPDLQALLNDDRFPMPRHYLRKLYPDPITQQPNWGLLEAPSGGVMGVYSLSAARPYKVKNFRPQYRHFENQMHYESWYFVYVPQPKR